MSTQKRIDMETQPTAQPKLYIGMDIHKKSWSVHLRTDISDHKTLTIPPDCDTLYDYVENNFQDHEVSLTYEAGCCGFSASRYFIHYIVGKANIQLEVLTLWLHAVTDAV